VAASLALAMLACSAPAPEAGDELTGITHDADVTQNALTANALTANALTANALTANALTANALTANPLARQFLKYVVGCALPAGAHLNLALGGQTYGFDGAIGLSPAWGNAGGRCDAGCRGWVSACVLSRLNYLGETVSISLRGSRSELSSSVAERQAYPRREAAYYGDVFASPQVRLGCLPISAPGDPRVCGPTLDGCAVIFVGGCQAVCDAAAADGSFPNCRDRARDASGNFPAGVKAYDASATVFLAN
jgi:hypothetical protein